VIDRRRGQSGGMALVRIGPLAVPSPGEVVDTGRSVLGWVGEVVDVGARLPGRVDALLEG
jgi:hypothetical protein